MKIYRIDFHLNGEDESKAFRGEDQVEAMIAFYEWIDSLQMPDYSVKIINVFEQKPKGDK